MRIDKILSEINWEATLAILVLAGAILFMLPVFKPKEPSLQIISASETNTTVSFTVKYTAPFPKICYLVVYGPFAFDTAGHQEGNNIYVLKNQEGTISDTLKLQEGKSLKELKIELWCEHTKKASAVYELKK